MDVIENEWGISNTYEDRIEINKKLNDFPDLKERVIAHELEHANIRKKGLKGWAKQRKVDALTEVKFKHLIPFIKKYPKHFFQQMLPITYSKKEDTVYFEWSLIILYISLVGITGLIITLITYFGKDSYLFWKIIKFTVIGLMGLFVLYKLGDKVRKDINKEANKVPEKKRKLTKQEKQLQRMGFKEGAY